MLFFVRNSVFKFLITFGDDPWRVGDDFINPFALSCHFDSLRFAADSGTCITNNNTFVLFDILLVTDTCNHPDLLVGKGLPTLLEDVGMTDVEGVKNTVCVDSDNFLFRHCSGIFICLFISIYLIVCYINLMLFIKFISIQRVLSFLYTYWKSK